MRDRGITQESELRSSISENLVELKQSYASLEAAFKSAVDTICADLDPKERVEQKKIVVFQIRTAEDFTRAAVYKLLGALDGANDTLPKEQVEVLEKELLEEIEKVFGMIKSEFKDCMAGLEKAKGMKELETVCKDFCKNLLKVDGCLELLTTEVSGLSDGSGIFVGVPNIYINKEYHKIPRDKIFDQRRLIYTAEREDFTATGFAIVCFRLLNGDKEKILDEAGAFLSGLKGKSGIRSARVSRRKHDEAGGETEFIFISVYFREPQRKLVLGALLPQVRIWMQNYEGITQAVVPPPAPVSAR